MKQSWKRMISQKISVQSKWNKRILRWKTSYDEVYKLLNGKKIKK